MANSWTCPRCEGINGAGIAVCDGFEEDPHEDVWMIDVLRGEAREAEAKAVHLRAQLADIRRAVDGIVRRALAPQTPSEGGSAPQGEDNRCHFGIEGPLGRCQNAATHRSEGMEPGEWFLWCGQHTAEFDEPTPSPPSAPTTEEGGDRE